MRRIQTWNGTKWIDATIETLPLGNNVIKVLEGPARVLYHKNIPIHICPNAPSKERTMTMIDLRLIRSGMCPYCHERISVSEAT